MSACDYLAHCLLWSAVWFLAGIAVTLAVTESAVYVRWKLSRDRRHHDHS